MRSLLVGFALLLGLAQAAPSKTIEDHAREYLALLVESSPVDATFLGIHTRDREFGDLTREGFGRVLARTRAFQKRFLAAVKPDSLSPEERLDFLLLDHRLKADIMELKRVQSFRRNPALYASLPIAALFIMVSREYASLERRAADVLARLEKIPEVLQAGRRNVINPPRLWTEIAIEQAGQAESFFAEIVPTLEKALPAEKERVQAARERASSAYRDYQSYLQKDLLPRSRGRFAAGPEQFNFYLRNNYFLDRDAGAILAMGREVLQQTEKQMDGLARRISPGKTWRQVLDDIKKDHPPAADLLATYRRETDRARAFVIRKDLFTFPQGEELRVIETPVFQRVVIPYAQYFEPAPFEESKTGFFTVTPVDPGSPPEKQEAVLRGHNYGDVVDTVTHEAYPGHHLQLSRARLVPSTMRKISGTPLFTEGWGLYAEELMAEQGYYDDRARLVQLQWVLVRAARVVLDVSLHTRGMTIREAADFLVERAGLERSGAEGEVRRYTLSPTQPLSYLLGRQLILEMRREAQRREGQKFSLKAFHDRLLGYGSISPLLIRQALFAD